MADTGQWPARRYRHRQSGFSCSTIHEPNSVQILRRAARHSPNIRSVDQVVGATIGTGVTVGHAQRVADADTSDPLRFPYRALRARTKRDLLMADSKKDRRSQPVMFDRAGRNPARGYWPDDNAAWRREAAATLSRSDVANRRTTSALRSPDTASRPRRGCVRRARDLRDHAFGARRSFEAGMRMRLNEKTTGSSVRRACGVRTAMVDIG